jgi:hypothetical protein
MHHGKRFGPENLEDEQGANIVMVPKQTAILRGHLRNPHRGVYALGRLAQRRVGLALKFAERISSRVCNFQPQFWYLAPEEAS